MIVDPHVPVSQQSGHAHTSYPPLSAAVAQVGRLEISRVEVSFVSPLRWFLVVFNTWKGTREKYEDFSE